ncbi:hypothetical protein FACS1894211_02250 [Clostridia bacterium]|nr:hypothetical protein FACS1894211_02250 [Clostridia bacterium]
MLLYIIVIIACASVFNALDCLVFIPPPDTPVWFVSLGVWGSTVAVIALDALLAWACRAARNRMNPFSRFFAVSQKGKRVLTKLGVRRFKRFLPDLGKVVKFAKGKIAEPDNKDYIYQYMLESCSGELGHWAGILFGFLIVFLFPLKYCLYFGIPVAFVNAVLSLLPALSLRYNRYALTLLYKKLERKEQN